MKLKKDIKLLGYQNDGVAFLLGYKYIVLADDMGLGKSIQAIASAIYAEKKCVIVCPSNLRINWIREISKFTEDANVLMIHTDKDAKKVTFNEDFYVVSYNMIQKIPFLFELTDFWVFDEAHFLKNPKAQRTKFVLDHLETMSRPEYLMLLTGTPITKRIPDFYTLLRFCSANPDLKTLNINDYFKDWFKFAQYFCKVNETTLKIKGRPRKITNYGELKDERIPELKKLLNGKYIRRLAKDYLDLLPLQRKNIVLSDSINKELETILEEVGKDVAKASVMEMKEKNANAKVRHTAMYVAQLHEETDRQVLIFTDHVGSAQNIALDLIKRGISSASITGHTSQKARQNYVDKFQQGELTCLVATIGTSSTGYTFTNCSDVVFNDYSWNPADNAQAEKRIHRIGQEHVCIIHRILGDATDERILELVESKQRDINKILED